MAVAAMGIGASIDAQAQRKSGRDRFGYTWLRTDTIGGPAFSWVDISATGTDVSSGLTDDNFIGPINIGFDFTYYWNTYNQVYIGSNGYVMFGRGDNIAQGTAGMPNIPDATDGKNNFIAPLLADLTFIQYLPNNTSPRVPNAKLYHQTIGNQFIITYSAVPYWNGTVASTNTSGANTFQLILDGSDSSFTIQYQTLTGTPSTATRKTVRGFEDVNGQNGSNFGTNTAVAQYNGKAYKVSYPQNSTFQITDLAAEGVSDQYNGAQFLLKGDPANNVAAVIRNAGTTDISAPFTVNVDVEDAQGNIVANSPITVNSLARGTRTTLSLPTPLPNTTPAGDYLVQISTSLPHDTISNNNNIAGELVIVDTTGGNGVFGYDVPDYSFTNQHFGATFGNYYELPDTGMRIAGAEFDMGWVDDVANGGPYPDSAATYKVIFYAGSSLPNVLGAALDSVNFGYDDRYLGDSIGVLNLSNTTDAGAVRRHRVALQTPIRLAGRGLYVGMIQTSPATNFFWNRPMADTIPPFSNRNYEIQGGAWGPDRNRGQYDYSLRVVTGNSIVATRPLVANTTAISAFPNPTQNTVTLTDALLKQMDRLSVLDINGRTVMNVDFARKGMGTVTFNVSSLQSGSYMVRGTSNGRTITSRFVKN